MDYYVVRTNELSHHGILGMKWGVRRWQNEDGTLTEAGKKHYRTKTPASVAKEINKDVRKIKKKKYEFANRFYYNNDIGPNSKDAYDKWAKDYKEFTNSKLFKEREKKLNRINYEDIDPEEYDRKWEAINKKYDSLEPMFRKLDGTATLDNGYKWLNNDFIKTYGREISIGNLMDLGFDKKSAEYIQDLLEKDNRMIGMHY